MGSWRKEQVPQSDNRLTDRETGNARPYLGYGSGDVPPEANLRCPSEEPAVDEAPSASRHVDPSNRRGVHAYPDLALSDLALQDVHEFKNLWATMGTNHNRLHA
jgi:hypothetical protein